MNFEQIVNSFESGSITAIVAAITVTEALIDYFSSK